MCLKPVGCDQYLRADSPQTDPSLIFVALFGEISPEELI